MNAMREIRNNQELRMKLDGMLTLKIEQSTDSRHFVVIHHVDRPDKKEIKKSGTVELKILKDKLDAPMEISVES
jgi:hypothetical protein